MTAMWTCLGPHELPVSTFVEVTWSVRPSGNRLVATDGRFERVQRGAVLPAGVLACLAAIRYGDHTFTVPGLRLPADFASRVSTTFLLAVPPARPR
jgi:hypothetical protein